MSDTKTILDLAKAVGAALEQADGLSIAVRPEVMLRPRLELPKLVEIRLLVVPSEQTFEPLTRGSIGWRPTVDVGLLAKCEPDDLEQGGKLLAFVLEIASSLVGMRPEGFEIGVATSVPENDPIWSAEQLQKGHFLTVLRIPFRATLRRASS